MAPNFNPITKVLKELIKLQYRNGSILELKALQAKELSEAELFDIIEDFKQHNLLQYVPLGSTNYTFYVLVPNDIENAFPYLGITIGHENLDYEYKKIFLETANQALGQLATSTDLINRVIHNHDEILRENYKISQEYRNFRKEIDTSTRKISESIREDEGIKEIHIYYTKEDGKKIHFIIPFTTIWISNHQDDSWEEIKEVVANIIDSFIQDNEFHLDHSIYKLKTICVPDKQEEESISIQNLNALASLTLEELLFEKQL
jgi:hypothetical protein